MSSSSERRGLSAPRISFVGLLGRPCLERASPSQIVGQVLGGDAVEAAHPFLEPTVIGVDVVDVEVGRLGAGLARRGHDVDRDVGPAGEGDDGLSAVADEPVGGGDEAVEGRRDRGAVHVRQHGVDSGALAVAGDEDGNVFEVEAGVLRLAASPARPAGRPERRPLNDSRMKVSSASTMPVSVLGLSKAGEPRNRCRQRNAVVGWTPQRSAALARLVPSSIAWAWSSHRSFLRSRAIGVLVRALKVRPQLLQR